MAWSKIRIGDFLKESKVESKSSNPDKRITVKLNVKGVEKRPYEKGIEGATKYYVRKSGQFIYGKQNLFKGAFGIIPDNLNGFDSSSDIPAFDVDKICVPEWLFYYLKQNDSYKKLEALATGTGSRRVQPSKFYEVPIPLPEVKIQKEIIANIKVMERNHLDIIQEIDKQLKLIRALRQSILQDAIQGKLIPPDPASEPSSVLLERIRKEKQRLIEAGQLKKEKPLVPIEETEISFELPGNWEWCRLGNITRINSGVTLGKSYKNELIKVPYLRVANVQRGWIDITEVKELNVPQAEIDKYQLRKGDLLLIEGGDWDKVGRCAIWDQDFEPFIHQNHIYCIRPIDNINNEYLEKYLNSPVARRYFESCSKQTTNLASINKTQLSNILVPLPPAHEQNHIVTKVNQLMSICDEMEQQIIQSKNDAEQLLQAVLQEAFEGKQIVPKHVSKQDQVFWQKQLLTSYINMLMEQHQEQGEMAIAKYTYLNDRVNNAGSGFRYVPHNFGPYSPEIKDCLTASDAPFCKKTVGKKGYEVYHINKKLEAGFTDPKNRALQEAQKGFRQLTQVFSIFPIQERARQLELVASICWLIEQHQNTDMKVLYNGLENWPTPKRQVQHKGQLFSKDEAAAAFQLIQQQGWHLKLLHQ